MSVFFKRRGAVPSVPSVIYLDYIQSSGGEYINTGFCPSYNSRVVADISDVTTEDFIFGARDTASSSAAKQFGVYINSSSGVRSDYFGTNKTAAPSSIAVRTTVDKNANVTTAYGLTITNTAVSSGKVTNTLYLFALNNAGAVTAQANMKLHSCQIYDNGTLVRDFRPCMLPDTHEVGLYDLVERKFYGNAGTGYFIPGPVISLPEGYTKLACIQSSGTQYIDAELYPNQNTGVVMDAEITDTSATGWLFCGRTAANTAAFGMYSYVSNGKLYFVYGTKSVTFSTATGLTRQTYTANKNTASAGGETVTATAQTFASSATLTLLARNTGGTIAGHAKAKLYVCAIYDNDLLVRLFTPCMAPDGSIGLYDSITEAFFGNKGTGVFTAVAA